MTFSEDVFPMTTYELNFYFLQDLKCMVCHLYTNTRLEMSEFQSSKDSEHHITIVCVQAWKMVFTFCVWKHSYNTHPWSRLANRFMKVQCQLSEHTCCISQTDCMYRIWIKAFTIQSAVFLFSFLCVGIMIYFHTKLILLKQSDIRIYNHEGKGIQSGDLAGLGCSASISVKLILCRHHGSNQ